MIGRIGQGVSDKFTSNNKIVDTNPHKTQSDNTTQTRRHKPSQTFHQSKSTMKLNLLLLSVPGIRTSVSRLYSYCTHNYQHEYDGMHDRPDLICKKESKIDIVLFLFGRT
jgi:hypothetical protein